MSVSQADVVEYIKNLKLAEVKSLIDVLEAELGVEASAPVMMGGMMPGAGAAVEEAEEQTEFDVVLKDFGAKKINVIKAVRALTGLGSRRHRRDQVGGRPCATTSHRVCVEQPLHVHSCSWRTRSSRGLFHTSTA